jgi:hypothetical protein
MTLWFASFWSLFGYWRSSPEMNSDTASDGSLMNFLGDGIVQCNILIFQGNDSQEFDIYYLIF